MGAGMRYQPQGRVQIARSSLARNLAFSIQGGSGLRDVVRGLPMTGRGAAQSIKPFVGGLAFDARAVNTAGFIDVGGAIDALVSDQTILFDLVIAGAYAGNVPAIGGVWRSTAQNDVMLTLERNGVDTLQVWFRIGGANANRSFSVGLSSLYGRRLTVSASIYRGAGRTVHLRIASEGVLLYDAESPYTTSGDSSDVTPTGTEYISVGSESIENANRNPNCIIYAHHHFGRVVSADEVVALSANQWQLYASPEEEYEVAATGGGPTDSTGTFASSLAAVSMAASGDIINAGSFQSALSGVTMLSSGTVANSPVGSFAASMDGVTMNASGSQLNAGSLASLMQGASMTASGIVAQHATGTLASTLGGVSMAAYGAVGDDEVPDGVVPHRYRWRVMRRHFDN